MKKHNDFNQLKALPIPQWDKEDKPRERMVTHGKKSLTNSELIAILLRTGIQGASAIDLAQAILNRSNGSLTNLARLEVSELQKEFKGIGTAKAVTVIAALELGNRMLSEQRTAKDDYAKDSRDLFHIIAPSIVDLPHEEFWVVCLSNHNKVTWKQRISIGGLTNTSVDLRVIFAAALEHRAVAVAVAHNHPSGNLTPSREDKALTQRLAEAGKLLSIKLVDHLIVGINPDGKADYFSFSENGLL